MCVWVCKAQVVGEREAVRGGYQLPFTEVGHNPSVAAAVRAAVHSAPVLKTPVRVPLPPIDG